MITYSEGSLKFLKTHSSQPTIYVICVVFRKMYNVHVKNLSLSKLLACPLFFLNRTYMAFTKMMIKEVKNYD